MWCTHCRQDVPALPASDTGTFTCPRCAGQIGAEATKPVEQPEPAYDGWELDEQLRHIGRVLESQQATTGRTADGSAAEAARFDFLHAGPPQWHFSAPASKRGQSRTTAGPTAIGALIWAAFSLGTMSLVCGGILLAWSMATGRRELWNVGLPVAIAGQLALVIGLVLQLERLWHDNREAITKLGNVDEQLHELKAATTLLGTGQGSGTSVFYSHLAGGAGPQILLTDLKSQIDLLALKIAQEGR